MAEIMSVASSGIGASLALTFFVGAYFFAVWDSRREDAGDDSQIGIKVVLFTLMIGALGIAMGGANTLLHYLLSGAKTGTPAIKAGLAGLVAGGIVLAALVLTMLPRTNSSEHTKILRLALGFIAAIAGSAAIIFFADFVRSMIMGGGTWAGKSGGLASFITFGAVGFLALNKLGALSGWVAAAKPAAPQAGYPPQQSGGMPQGGYPPQGGMPQQGYPPQQSGQVPQQQQYPPQQQGGVPQQGGYPPQGGGGYPPQGGGGGYPPR